MPNFDFYRPSNGTYGHENGHYINSAPVSYIDTYEDNDISEYSVSGKTPNTVTSPVWEGSYSLEFWCTDSTDSRLKSTSGLSNYPKQGTDWQFHVYHSTGAGAVNVRFGDGSAGYYEVHTSFGSSEYHIRKDGTSLDSTLQTPKTDVWLRYDVYWASDGTITVDVYDETNSTWEVNGKLSATDTAYTGGSYLAFQRWTASGNPNQYSYFDNIRYM